MKYSVSILAAGVALTALSVSSAEAARTRTPRTPPPPPATAYNGMLVEQIFETDGSRTSNRQTSAPRSISFDSGTQSYTVREFDGTAFTFSGSELVPAESDATFSVYRDAATGVTFRLLNAGTTNPLIGLSYVRYGAWNRAIAPTTGYTSAVKNDWMVFGSQTPLANTPRTGSATYSAVLDGTYRGTQLLSGTAGLTADFATGALGMFINPQVTNAATGAVTSLGGFKGTGAINYTTGEFTGSDTSSNYIFTYRGNFYGPAAQEVGGAFNLSIPTSTGGTGGGIFVGAQGPLPVAVAEYAPPPPPPATGPGSLSVERIATVGGSQTSSPAGATISFDVTSGTYLLRERDGTAFAFGPSQRVDGESTSSVSVYRDPITGATFRQLNASAPEVALTYVTFGSWRRPVATAEGPGEKIIHVVYGSPTQLNAMPQTGTASYAARLDGTLSSASGLHDLGGTAQFNADFAARRMNYTLRPVATIAGSSVTFADMSGVGSISGASFTGRSSTHIPAYSTVQGGFFGPTAQEVGGTFMFSTSTTYGAPVSGSGAGAFVGKQ